MVYSPSAAVGSLSTLSASAPCPGTHTSPDLAPLVGLSGFPSCLFVEQLEVIQGKIIRRVRGLEDASCKERLGLVSLMKKRLGGNLIAAYNYSEDSYKDDRVKFMVVADHMTRGNCHKL